MLSVQELHKRFDGVEVLRGVSAEIGRGDVVCIIGPSGSGKSTFLRCLNRLERPDSGKIFLDGVELTAKKVDLDRQRQKMGIARALLSRAEYMIFDEATSSVDPESEQEIFESIINDEGGETAQ